MAPSVESPLHPQLLTVLLFVFLAWVIFRRVPVWLLGLAGAFLIVSLFAGNPFTDALGRSLSALLGPVLAFALLGVGLRMILGLGRRCSHCHCCHCCCHRHRQGRF